MDMKKYLQGAGLAMLAITAMLSSSCKKNAAFDSLSTGNFADTAGSLKATAASSFANMGMAVTYTPMLTIAKYLATVKREANIVTFGNELKEGSIVNNAGTYDYTTADALYNLCANNGLGVYGHTLVWYSQQNATYLNGLITALTIPGSGGTPAPNLMAGLNGDFETGTGNAFTGWNNIAGGASAATFTAGTGNGSTRSLQANVTTPGVNAYDVQSIGPNFAVTPGHVINFSVDIKASTASGKVRVVVQNVNYLQFDIVPTTAWATYTFSLTVNEASPIIRFNFPNAGVYNIDNMVITDPTQAVPAVGATLPTAAQSMAAIDNEMKRYITTTMTRYSGKIKAWDVVNEPLADNGQIRTPSNYTIPSANLTNQFLYAKYIGTNKYDANNYILHAFQYAKAADPTSLRFINDYNLEYARVKTDSLKALVTYINANNSGLVDGIGTQLHLNLGANLSNIDYMFKTLASTGLKIRISELDVAINGAKTNPFAPDALLLSYQAAMYKYVIQSYLANVPAAQRYGVTVWGVSDTDSWLNTPTSPDAPLLFDSNYLKKAAYGGFKQGFQ
jgi:endo-1,4-beta-xylanase